MILFFIVMSFEPNSTPIVGSYSFWKRW